MSKRILQAVAVVAELTGTTLSEVAMRVMVDDLSKYPDAAVLHALDRCRHELAGRLTLAAVIERINDNDGRPTADEAWALALDARDEANTVVWTDEAQEAFALARPVLDAGDKVGARMAFRDAYERIVRDARLANRPAQWSASLGWDPAGRTQVLEHAQRTGLLSAPMVAQLLPPPQDTGLIGAALEGRTLPAPTVEGDFDNTKAVANCERLKAMLSSGTKLAPPVSEDRERLARLKAEAAAKVAERLTIENEAKDEAIESP